MPTVAAAVDLVVHLTLGADGVRRGGREVVPGLVEVEVAVPRLTPALR